MVEMAKKMIGLDSGSENNCEEKVQEKAADKIYEKLWPILSDRLCSKFEENAENMSGRITDYMMHQLDEKPALILPVIQKMLEIMKPVTNNTEEERKNLVDLLENITNKANELRNREEIIKSNAPPEAKPTGGMPTKPDFDFEKDGKPSPAPSGTGLLGTVGSLAKMTPMGAMAAGLADKAGLPTDVSSLTNLAGAIPGASSLTNLAGALPTDASSLTGLAGAIPGASSLTNLAGSIPTDASALTNMAAGALPTNTSSLTNMAAGALPTNASALTGLAGAIPGASSLTGLAGAIPAGIPTNASSLTGLAGSLPTSASALTGAPPASPQKGGNRIIKTYKNRLIKKLYGKTRANKSNLKLKRVSPKKKST